MVGIIRVLDSLATPDSNITPDLSKLAEETSWPCYLVEISECFREDGLPNVVRISETSQSSDSKVENKTKLIEAFQSIRSKTAKEEFMRRIRLQLMVDVAVSLSADGIFIASSGTRLASQLITDVAQGKGNQVHLETVS